MSDDNDDYIDDLFAMINIDLVDCLDVWFIFVDVSDNFIFYETSKCIFISKIIWLLCVQKIEH